MTSRVLEYIWVDGGKPTARVRSKTKILPEWDTSLPEWSFDGSSTNQAEGHLSDCILKPVLLLNDPIRGANAFLVLCEVYTLDGQPHASNKRRPLAEIFEANPELDPWVGFEQEYTLYDGSRPLGFPSERRFPPAQGPYYCGVGADEVAGRELVEAHMNACMGANIPIVGVNAEVMPGQWEFQIGGPGIDPLAASDFLWIARWLLYRLGEGFGINATLDPKPVPGDWNGAGMHTNFSTALTREEGGLEVIKTTLDEMANRVSEHLACYGAGYEIRLTGHHETCRFDQFKYGVSDRTASVRIPASTASNGFGYFEDRRPNANADPYEVALALMKSTLKAW